MHHSCNVSSLALTTACPAVTQDLVSDVHCIIEAMIGKGSEVMLQRPQVCVHHAILPPPHAHEGPSQPLSMFPGVGH